MGKPKTLGDRLRFLRTYNGKSQNQMAKEIGINRRTLSNWENGWTEPNATCVKMLVEYFGTTYDFLIDGKMP